MTRLLCEATSKTRWASIGLCEPPSWQYQKVSVSKSQRADYQHLVAASSPWLASLHCNTTHTDVQLWSKCSSWISAFRVISHWFYFLNCCTLITGCQVRFLCGAIISVWGYGHFSWSRNKGWVRLTDRMNFRKSSERGGRGHFQSKNLYCKIWTFKQGFLTMKLIQKGLLRICFHPITMLNIWTTCISWEIGSYNTQKSLQMNIRTFVAILSWNPQYNFPKMRGGVKGRLERFRKFIRFGNVLRP